MAIHYFLVAFDTEANEWALDAETEGAFMPDGTIYDTDAETWHSDYVGDGVYFPRSEELTATLQTAIVKMNKADSQTETGSDNDLDDVAPFTVCPECDQRLTPSDFFYGHDCEA